MVVQLTDKSLDSTTDRLSLHIFHPKIEEMPEFRLGDIVVAKGMRVQVAYNTTVPSLLTTYETAIYIYRAQASSPNGVGRVHTWLKHPGDYSHKYSHPGSLAVEGAYATYLHRDINKDALPSVQSFDDDRERFRVVAKTSRELKDVVDFQYCDLFVHIVTDPVHYADSGKAVFWVSDYTVNDKFRDFWNQGHNGPGASNDRSTDVGDEQGYLTKFGSRNQHQAEQDFSSKWPGPFGRRSIKIECHPPHASIIERDSIKRGSWVKLNNVHIKYFHHTGRLEAFLHEDRQFGDVQRVFLYDPTGLERHEADERYLAAMRRKRDYEKTVQKPAKRKALHDSSAPEAGKALNAKQRRKLNRAGAGKTQAANAIPLINQLNPSIASENPNQAVVPLSRLLDPSLFKAPGPDGLQLPFANIKFKSQVRVVDFLPDRLLDFAVRRRTDEYEILGDEGSSSSSSEDDDEGVGSGGGGQVVWEWRFALCLEDASSTAPTSNSTGGSSRPARFWAVIDNFQGQTLLRRDACDLRKNSDARDLLRETMFLLWGNLEENKLDAERRKNCRNEAAKIRADEAARQKEIAEAAARMAEKDRARKKEEKRVARERRQREHEKITIKGGNLRQYGPPDGEDSDGGDDDDDDADNNSNGSKPSQALVPAMASKTREQLAKSEERLAAPVPELNNRPFVCCLQQYGLRSRGDSAGEDDGGDQGEESGESEKVWQPMLGMFGTVIRDSSC